MLDIKFIRENKDIVAAAIKNKNREVDLDLLLELSDKRKALKQEIDTVNQGRNEAAQARDAEKGTQLKKEIEVLEKDFTEIDKQFFALMAKVPNIPSPDTPIGPDESANKVIRTWGDKPQFDFEPKEHDELGKNLGILDIETAGEISGSRFAYIKGDLALIQFALLQFCFSLLTNKEKRESIAKEAGVSVEVTPFIPIIPPVF